MSKKKNKNRVEYVKVVGTPTMLMLPARNYKFRVNTKEYVITIPRKGKYIEFDKELFTEEDGDFDVLAPSDEKDVESILYMPSLTKVLFGASRYPDLEENQAFTPIAIVFREEEVDIVGNVIEMLKEDD